jgi:WD40 repeat protein
MHVYGKHSATVTSINLSEELNVLVSGSLNGEIVIWSIDYKNPPNQLPDCRLMFKDKIVVHYDQIKNITINTDLRIAAVSSRDGYVSIIDLMKC